MQPFRASSCCSLEALSTTVLQGRGSPDSTDSIRFEPLGHRARFFTPYHHDATLSDPVLPWELCPRLEELISDGCQATIAYRFEHIRPLQSPRRRGSTVVPTPSRSPSPLPSNLLLRGWKVTDPEELRHWKCRQPFTGEIKRRRREREQARIDRGSPEPPRSPESNDWMWPTPQSQLTSPASLQGYLTKPPPQKGIEGIPGMIGYDGVNGSDGAHQSAFHRHSSPFHHDRTLSSLNQHPITDQPLFSNRDLLLPSPPSYDSNSRSYPISKGPQRLETDRRPNPDINGDNGSLPRFKLIHHPSTSQPWPVLPSIEIHDSERRMRKRKRGKEEGDRSREKRRAKELRHDHTQPDEYESIGETHRIKTRSKAEPTLRLGLDHPSFRPIASRTRLSHRRDLQEQLDRGPISGRLRSRVAPS